MWFSYKSCGCRAYICLRRFTSTVDWDVKFCMYSLVMSVSTMLASVAILGFPTLLVREVAVLVEGHRWAELSGLLIYSRNGSGLVWAKPVLYRNTRVLKTRKGIQNDSLWHCLMWQNKHSFNIPYIWFMLKIRALPDLFIPSRKISPDQFGQLDIVMVIVLNQTISFNCINYQFVAVFI